MRETEYKIYKWLKWPIDLSPIVFLLWVFTDPVPVHRPPWFTFLPLLEDALYFYLFWGIAAFFLRWAFGSFIGFALNIVIEIQEFLKNNTEELSQRAEVDALFDNLRYERDEDKIKRGLVPYCYIYAALWGVLLSFLFGILFRIG